MSRVRAHQPIEYRPVCKVCGKAVAQPRQQPDGRTRGNCPEHGRVNTKWVPR